MIEFHQLALEELRRATAWYRWKSATVAERFFPQMRPALDGFTTIQRLIRRRIGTAIAYGYRGFPAFSFIESVQIRTSSCLLLPTRRADQANAVVDRDLF